MMVLDHTYGLYKFKDSTAIAFVVAVVRQQFTNSIGKSEHE